MMQRLLIIFLLVPLLTSAQNYPIVKDSAVWRKISNYLVNPPNHFETHKLQYLMQGDTIVNNQSYKKVFSTQYDSLIYNLVYIGAMRENNNGQVYFLRDTNFPCGHLFSVPDSMEVLLYDFSLQQGDTFYLQVDVGSVYDSAFTVDYTDSVLVDGTWRKRIVFYEGFYEPRTWIEGIGSIEGLFFPYLFIFENWDYLVCYEDASVHWENPDSFYYCYTGNPIVGLDDRVPRSDQKQISIYPNPSGNILNIKTYLPIDDIKEILIYDMHGRAVKEQAFDSATEISDLPPGIYILELRLEGGRRVTERFVKK